MYNLLKTSTVFSLLTTTAIAVAGDLGQENAQPNHTNERARKTVMFAEDEDQSSVDQFTSGSLMEFKQENSGLGGADARSHRSGTSYASSRSSLWEGLKDTLRQAERTAEEADENIVRNDANLLQSKKTLDAVAALLADSDDSQNVSGCGLDDSVAEEPSIADVDLSETGELQIAILKEKIESQQSVADAAYDLHEEYIATANTLQDTRKRLKIAEALEQEAIARLAIAEQQLILADIIGISHKADENMQSTARQIRQGAQEQSNHWSGEKAKHNLLAQQLITSLSQPSKDTGRKRTLLDKLFNRNK